MWLSALALFAVPAGALIVPAFPSCPMSGAYDAATFNRPWLTLMHQRAFVCVALIAALVLGSHAMYDSFAVIRWINTGVHPATTGVLWGESVAAEVVVFLLIGPSLLRLLHPTGALALSALCGLLRWAVMAQTTDVIALALIQPLHGLTFALLHLASMRIIADTVPRALAATAQADYGLVAVGGTTAFADGRVGLALRALRSRWLLEHGIASRRDQRTDVGMHGHRNLQEIGRACG